MSYGVRLYNTCLKLFNISCLFSGEITISSIFPRTLSVFGFTIFSAILFPMNSLVASGALCINYLEEGFRASIPVFVTVSNSFFSYLLEGCFADDKNLYSWRYYLFLGSIK